MSLLEVLVAMFVILFGLLGVAALLPVGRFNIVEMAKRDRAGACGRAALHDIRARAMTMTNPNYWLAWYDANHPYTNWNQSNACTVYTPGWARVPALVKDAGGNVIQEYEQYLQHYRTFCIDPLYIAHYLSETPAASQNPNDVVRFPNTSGAPIYMGRCSWATDDTTLLDLHSGNLSNPINAALVNPYVRRLLQFDRLFTWPDDQIFDMPTDPQQRPVPQLDPGGVGQYEGDYSWMITVSPAVAEQGQSTGGRSMYDVSVVVFYKRDFSPPSSPSDPEKPAERIVTVQFNGLSRSGDVTLTSPAGAPAGTLDVRENDWLMVGGREALGPAQWRNVFVWYRIIALEEQNPSTPNQRLATLAGPDWNWGNPATGTVGWRADTDGDGDIDFNDAAQGVICTGVIGVYSQMMEIN